MTIQELYRERCNTPHNIDQHLPVLFELARECRHITEFGTDIGFSTTAFLAAQPLTLDCYDVVKTPWVEILKGMSELTDMRFHLVDTLQAVILPTDLLFIDTIHSYEQVNKELLLHGHRAKRFLVFHDIVAFPEIVPAISEYVEAHPEWSLRLWCEKQSGLAVYERANNGSESIWINTPAVWCRSPDLVEPIGQGI